MNSTPGTRDASALGIKSPTKPLPPPESPTSGWRHRWIVFSFWAVVVCLGLPHWIWTTSIHRSDLPLEVMNSWADGKACQLQHPMHIRLSAPELDAKAETELTAMAQKMLRSENSLTLFDFKLSNGPFNDSWPSSLEQDQALAVLLRPSDSGERQASLRSWVSVLDVEYGADYANDMAGLAAFISQQLQTIFEDEQQALLYLLGGTPYATSSSALLDLDKKRILDARTTRTFKYATSYHLTFSLFTSAAAPSSWDIEAAMEQYMKPLVNALSSISRFTVDTQVQLHASFSPSIAGPQFDAASGKWQLQKTDLSGFINAAEWPLSPSIGAGPTINFVLYVPSKDQSPLEIAETGGTSWLIPQWGGVQILNPSGTQRDELSVKDLEPVMLTFANQLTALIGLPPSPSSLSLRLSSLARQRATSLILSASSTMGALARLTLKLTAIAIPDTVAKSVDETLERLDKACQDLREGRISTALESARIANDEAERAFFEPSMVGQVYFPDEHKVAVYVPLLGPMAVPLFLAAIKEIRKLRSSKLKTS